MRADAVLAGGLGRDALRAAAASCVPAAHRRRLGAGRVGLSLPFAGAARRRGDKAALSSRALRARGAASRRAGPACREPGRLIRARPAGRCLTDCRFRRAGRPPPFMPRSPETPLRPASSAVRTGTMRSYLDFEKPVAELEAKVEELRALGASDDARRDRPTRSARLEAKAAAALKDLYAGADALAEDAGRAPSAAAAFRGLLRRADRASSRRSPATASSARTRRSSAASAASAAPGLRHRPGEGRPRPRPASGTISAWRARRATARRCG